LRFARNPVRPAATTATRSGDSDPIGTGERAPIQASAAASNPGTVDAATSSAGTMTATQTSHESPYTRAKCVSNPVSSAVPRYRYRFRSASCRRSLAWRANRAYSTRSTTEEPLVRVNPSASAASRGAAASRGVGSLWLPAHDRPSPPIVRAARSTVAASSVRRSARNSNNASSKSSTPSRTRYSTYRRFDANSDSTASTSRSVWSAMRASA